MLSNVIAAIVSMIIAAEVTLPPLECRYEPVVPYTVTELDLRYIPAVCGKVQDRRILACTYTDRDDIFMPKVDGKVITKEVYDALLIHEKGHVNCDDWHPEKIIKE